VAIEPVELRQDISRLQELDLPGKPRFYPDWLKENWDLPGKGITKKLG